MKILFYSIKGGQGKTTHSISYAKHRDCFYVTNDHESGTVSIYSSMFSENQLQVIKPEDSLDIPVDFDIVFDFGGWVDERVNHISGLCDVVVVPICHQSKADLMPCMKLVKSLSKYNENIVILINNTEKNEAQELKAHLSEMYPALKVFVINKSRYIGRLADEGKTVTELYQQGGLTKHMIKPLFKQFNDFYNYLDNF